MKNLFNFKIKIRHILTATYSLIAFVVFLKLLNIIQVNWLTLASPFLFCFTVLTLYLITLFIWSLLHKYNLKTKTYHFFCSYCAKPLKKPILRKKSFQPKCKKCK